MTDPIRIYARNARRETDNEFVGDDLNPPEYVSLFGGDADTVLMEGDDSGVRYRIDLFGVTVTGQGAVANFDFPDVDAVESAVLHIRARCVDADDRPAVTVQSIFGSFGSNLYRKLGMPAYEWSFYFPEGPAGVTANFDLDLMNPPVDPGDVLVDDAVVPYSKEQWARWFTEAEGRPGPPAIGFQVGGYGSQQHEVYECWIDLVPAPLEEPEEEVSNITGLGGLPRTRFFPA